MMDARYEKSHQLIKEAFLKLLETKDPLAISMAELAREAGISRSTVYEHFNNTQELLREVIVDFASNLRSLRIQMRCDECSAVVSHPFCVLLQEQGPYYHLVRCRDFLPLLIEVIEEELGREQLWGSYRELTADDAQARALLWFQMSGCYYAAIASEQDTNWQSTQQVLDTFIRGGLGALRSARN